MTQSPEKVGDQADELTALAELSGQQPSATRRAGLPRGWWRRPWIVPAAIISVAFVSFSLPPYLGLDPAKSRIHIRTDLPGHIGGLPIHYALLVGHITFGTIAILTVPLQVWPWLRRRHPAVHRFVGRTYIFAGVLPAGLLALSIVPFAASPAGNAIGALMWLGTTFTGLYMARKRNYLAHRRWMVYSFALCYQIVEGRVMLLTIPHIPGFHASSLPLMFETAGWIGVLINLLIAQCWLEYTARRSARRRAAAALAT